MDLQSTVSDFVIQAKNLCQTLQAVKIETLSALDLHNLRVQLHLLDTEAATMQNLLFAKAKGLIPGIKPTSQV